MSPLALSEFLENMSHDLTSGGESSPDPATDKDSWELNQLPRESKMPAAGYDENHRYDHPSESTPFISAASSTRSASGGDALGADDPRDKYKWSVIVLSFSIAFVLELGMGVSMPAWNALLEKGLCGETYPDIAGTLVIGDDNPLCKNATVQGKLAMYRGWTFTLEALPSMSAPRLPCQGCEPREIADLLPSHPFSRSVWSIIREMGPEAHHGYVYGGHVSDDAMVSGSLYVTQQRLETVPDRESD